MATPPQLIYNETTIALPDSYTLPAGVDLEFASVVARINGAGASGPFIVVLDALSQDNKVQAQARIDQQFVVGDTGVVAFAPFLRRRPTSGVVPSAGATRLATSPQSIPNALLTDVGFTTEEYDNDGLYDPAFPGRFTPQTPGFYAVSCYVVWAAVAGSDFREIYLLEGLTGNLIVDSKMSIAGFPTGHEISGTFRFASAPVAGQFLHVQVQQNSGGGLVVNTVNISWNVVWLGPPS